MVSGWIILCALLGREAHSAHFEKGKAVSTHNEYLGWRVILIRPFVQAFETNAGFDEMDTGKAEHDVDEKEVV